MSTTIHPTLSRFSTHSSQTLDNPPPLPPIPAHVPQFSATFTDPRIAAQRKAYIKSMLMGSAFLTIVVFGVFAIYWGALWKIPDNKLSGWVVDFDGGSVGKTVVDGLLAENSHKLARVHWEHLPASDFTPFGGPDAVGHWIVEQKAWIAVVINENASNNLSSAISSINPSYNGSHAITILANEARSENAFRSIVRPYILTFLNGFLQAYGQTLAKDLASSQPSAIAQIFREAPHIITQPVGYTLNNIRPFDIPAASAITFVGLIYLLVLCFVIVQLGAGARFLSGLERKLSTPSLIKLRLTSILTLYFFISLFYSALSAAFQVDFGRKYGNAGFLIFWALNFLAMCAVGLALESMITILTPRFIPFFVIFWIIVNVSVCFMPIEILPSIYHYGYATPFWHVSSAIRSILFRTKNTLGLNFAVLIIWTSISLISLPLFQFFMRRKMIAAAHAQARPQVDEKAPTQEKK